MYVELLVLIENKVYLKNMLFDEVYDLKAHVILIHTWFLLVPLRCLKFVVLKKPKKVAFVYDSYFALDDLLSFQVFNGPLSF